jgi:sn-glycerol 3-phosphate transport system permease protein
MSEKRTRQSALVFALKLIIGLIIVSPILFGFSFSFMSPAERAEIPPHLLPREPVIYTYQRVMAQISIIRLMVNSLIVCAIIITGQIITCGFAAFAFAFYRFRGNKLIFMIVLSTMMIPADAIIIANYLTISQFRLYDTYMGLVAPYLSSAMGIFLMRQFFLTIPRELHEAAIIDGCRDLPFLFRIVFPISMPAIASLGIYIFIQTYNQFLWPLLVTNSNRMRTVQIGMSILKEGEIVDYGFVLAGAVLILIPSVLVFVIGQKYMVKGMTAGAVKG